MKSQWANSVAIVHHGLPESNEAARRGGLWIVQGCQRGMRSCKRVRIFLMVARWHADE
jgi:hypothetical protein